jgi:hypothetical protein
MPKKEKPRGKAKSNDKKLRQIKSPHQLALVKKLSAVVRNTKGKQKRITLGKLMREVGYSIETSKKPYRVLKSKNFQALLDDYLPDDTIAEVHGEALRASKLDHYVFPAKEDDEVIKDTVESVEGCKLIKIRKQLNWKRAYFYSPDTQNRLKAIAEAYKVKGKYPAEKHEVFVAKVEVTQF